MNFRFVSFQGQDYRHLFAGLEDAVPLASGRSATGINFDNAATTPPFLAVLEEIRGFAPTYASVHRGAGYKSILSSQFYEQARLEVMKFVGANPQTDVVVFTKNATEGINKLSYHLWNRSKKEVVLSTWMEHNSNLLPWRDKFQVEHVEVDEFGRLRLEDLQEKLEKFQGRVKLVTVSGASNVTGHMNPIYKIAEMAHRYGTKILVDGAQLVPHAPVVMKSRNKGEQLDFLVFSAHKMYAPFGTGVLIGSQEVFEQASPEYAGGGTVRMVTMERVVWDSPPHKQEAGTPNLMGAVALVAATRTLSAIGMRKVFEHEAGLLEYAYGKLRSVEGLTLYGRSPKIASGAKQIGVLPFNVQGMDHEQVAEILSQERGIAVRNGCFCAQPYVQRLLGISDHEAHKYLQNPALPHPGMVRASFGLYNTRVEIDILAEFLQTLAGRRPKTMAARR